MESRGTYFKFVYVYSMHVGYVRAALVYVW